MNPPLELEGRAIHLWTVAVDADATLSEQYETILAPEERSRAARFRFAHLRRSFCIVRGALRILLGRYLHVPPADIAFAYGAKGKPALAASSGLDFNLSHSGGWAVLAFTRGCEIGVDLEQMRPLADRQNIAARYFCPAEAAELEDLPAAQREHAFFLCWTRKEAYIKATGDGLAASLNAFQVSLKPGERARMVHIAGDPDAAQEWTLHDLDLAPGCAAALAYRDAERPLALQGILTP